MSDAAMQDTEKVLTALAKALSEILGNEVGFVLLTFNFGDSGRANYVSNAKREDVLNVLREYVSKHTFGEQGAGHG